jgi:hypothetical protein
MKNKLLWIVLVIGYFENQILMRKIQGSFPI